MKAHWKLLVAALCVGGFASGQMAASTAAQAEDYPTRPLKAVVSYTAGSGADILARYFTEELAKSIGQPVIVENRPGAGGNIGANVVAKAPPDGYTMFITPSAPVTGNFVLY
jgi:tripartite-type tricarboxylate transporter receptor subunit TctC